MAGNIVEEIFRMKSDTAQIIKELQTVKGVYKELTDEQQKQVIELGLLEAKEKSLLAARNKSTNPTMIIRINKELDDNLKKLGALKEATDRFTKSETAAKQEANALATAVNNAFKSTQVAGAGKQIEQLGAQAAGATKSGFNPLNNSVNQLSRELPAFAVSANVGFLAISNNLPIFFDALQRINKENAELAKGGVKTSSVLSQLGSAVFSFGSLLSVGVTLLTIYGGAIAKTIASAFSAKDAFELEKEALATLNKEYDRQISLQKELLTARNNTNKETAKLKLSDPEKELLNATDKALDNFEKIERGYKQSVSKAIIQQLQFSEKEVDISTKRSKDAIIIENKKTGTIIRLNLEMNKVLGTYSAFYNKQILSRQDLAIQAQLNKLDKARQDSLKELNLGFNAEVDKLEETESKKSSIRQKYSEQELIRQRSVADEIKQLQIDANTNERGREEENIRFENEKKLRAIDDANALEAEKLSIAKANYIAHRSLTIENAKSDVDGQKQLTIDLLDLEQDYNKQVKKIKSDNITDAEQNELRYQLRLELLRKLAEVEEKAAKEINEKIRIDFEKTYKARIGILNENKDFELFLLEDKYAEEKKKGKRASEEELKRLKDLILAKKIEILKDNAQQKIDGLVNDARKNGAEANSVQILEIENKLQNDIERLKKKGEAVDKKSFKDRLKEYVDYFADIFHAAVNATNKILELKIKEVDGQINEQTRRVEAAKNIADRGNAEILQMEQERLDSLTKKKEKFVRDQQALAAVELVANTAIAVSKAAAQGGVAAGVTIAAALIALVAGLASARAIASQAAFYDGGLYDGEGYTGDGNPREVQTTFRKPYTGHKQEFIFNHKTTRKFRDVFEDVHHGKIDLNEWKKKAHAYDSLASYKPFTSGSPVYSQNNTHTIVRLGQVENKLDEMNTTLRHLKLGLNIDENGFTDWMTKRVERNNFIKNLAKP